MLCCDARMGLRILGWWWLIVVIANLAIVWMPFIWLLCAIDILCFLACFVRFIQMTQSNDHPDKVGKLAETYKFFGLIGATLSQVGGVIYWACATVAWLNKNSYYNNYKVNVGGLIAEIAVILVVYGGVRLYFYSVMKKYHEACKEAPNGAGALLVQGVPGVVVT